MCPPPPSQLRGEVTALESMTIHDEASHASPARGPAGYTRLTLSQCPPAIYLPVGTRRIFPVALLNRPLAQPTAQPMRPNVEGFVPVPETVL